MKLVYTGWKEISEALGYHEDTLRLMVKEEGLPIVMVRGRPWLSITALDRWLERKGEAK